MFSMSCTILVTSSWLISAWWLPTSCERISRYTARVCMKRGRYKVMSSSVQGALASKILSSTKLYKFLASSFTGTKVFLSWLMRSWEVAVG